MLHKPCQHFMFKMFDIFFDILYNMLNKERRKMLMTLGDIIKQYRSDNCKLNAGADRLHLSYRLPVEFIISNTHKKSTARTAIRTADKTYRMIFNTPQTSILYHSGCVYSMHSFLFSERNDIYEITERIWICQKAFR